MDKTLKTLCKMKESSYKRPYIVWFCLYDMSGIGESIVRKQIIQLKRQMQIDVSQRSHTNG